MVVHNSASERINSPGKRHTTLTVMKSTPKIQQLLIDLQMTDNKIRSIRSEAEGLEETVQLKQVIARRRNLILHRRQIAQTIVRENQALDDINAQRATINRDLKSIASHVSSGASGQTSALNQKKAQDQARLSQLDDEEKQHRTALSEAQTADDILAHNDAHLKQAGLDIKERRDDKIDHLRRRMALQRSRRDVCVQGIPADIVNMYEQFARRGDGHVVVRYVEGHLDHTDELDLSDNQLAEIAAAESGDILPFEQQNLLVAHI
jgi:predicted  nucleic acid-binding Zn-ribbon protein